MAYKVPDKKIISNYLAAYQKANGFQADFVVEYRNGRFYVDSFCYTSKQMLDMTQILYQRARNKELDKQNA